MAGDATQTDVKTANDTKILLTTEKILSQIGEYGLFQRLLNALVCLIYFFISFQVLIMYFTTLTPSWQCRSNSSVCLLNGTRADSDTARCNMSRNEWYYTKHAQYSLVTQFDLHCERLWLVELLSSVHFIGWGIGAIILGLLGDKYGRKLLLFPSIAVVIVVGVTSSFLPNIYMIVASRFVIGFFMPGSFVQSNILISEFVGHKHRPFATISPFITYTIGFCVLGLKAYLLENWVLLSIVCTAPYVFILPFYILVPESVRWLQANGRLDEAKEIFHRISRYNKHKLPSDFILTTHEPDTTRSNCTATVQGFNNGLTILHTIVQCFIWLVVSMCFFGLQLAANELEGSLYRDFVLLSIVQIPATAISIGCSTKFGRKKTNLICLLIAGASCLGIAFIPSMERYNTVRVALAISGKIFVSATFQSLYLWSVEIFPVSIRSQGMGLVQVAARMGATGAPWVVVGLKKFGHSVPFIVIAVPTLVGTVLGLCLPETNIVGTIAKKKEKDEGEVQMSRINRFYDTNAGDEEKVTQC